MLGKGLESLIPPRQSSDDDVGAQSDAQMNGEPADVTQGKPLGAAQGKHEHLAPPSSSDMEPQVLSFDFVGGQKIAEDAPVAGEALANESSAPDFSAQMNQPREEEKQKEKPAEEVLAGHVYHIEVSKISPNPNQPRRNFSEEGIAELARSIREFGFLQPLVVSRREKEISDGIDVEYELIAGERRLFAAKALGLDRVPAIIREVDLEREKLELAVIENIQREDLSPIERARAFQRLQEEFRLTQREIAAKLGKSRETVANTVRLLDLPAYIQEALEKKQITESHGRFLLAIGDQAAQKKLFDDIVSHGLTTRDVKRIVRREKPGGGGGTGGDTISPELKALEEKLTAELGTPVKIERGENQGKITVTFYSDEELRHIVERFGGERD